MCPIGPQPGLGLVQERMTVYSVAENMLLNFKYSFDESYVNHITDTASRCCTVNFLCIIA